MTKQEAKDILNQWETHQIYLFDYKIIDKNEFEFRFLPLLSKSFSSRKTFAILNCEFKCDDDFEDFLMRTDFGKKEFLKMALKKNSSYPSLDFTIL
jgi:hypothetical protein